MLAVYLGTVVVGSLGLAYIYDALLPFQAAATAGHEHGHAWWAWAAAMVLGALSLYFAADDLRRFVQQRRAPASTGSSVTVEVEGLTCDNCVRKLERALRDTEGVTSATVTLEPGQATVEGEARSSDIEAAVRSAGYAVK